MSNINYIDNTNKLGLLNKIKYLVDLIVEKMDLANDNYGNNMSEITRRFSDIPQVLNNTYENLFSGYKDPYTQTVRWCSDLAKSVVTQVVVSAKELLSLDYSEVLSVLARDMYTNGIFFRRVLYTVNQTPSPYNIGDIDILITTLTPVSWGVLGLVDSFDSVPKPVDHTPLVFYESFDVVALSSENDDTPATLQVVGDLARKPSEDFMWVQGGSGSTIELTSIVPDSNINYVPNGSFERVHMSGGPENWNFYDIGATWGPTSRVYYSANQSSHGKQSLQINNEFTSEYGMYTLLETPLEPFKVYFLLFDAYATHTMPTNARLRFTFKDSTNAISYTQPPVGFYNSVVAVPFGSGPGKVPHDTNAFGTVVVPVVTDHRVVRERKYRLELTLTLDPDESWPTNGSVFLDRLVLVPGQPLYPLGPYMACVGGKPNQVRVGDRWTVTIDRDGNPGQYEYWSWWTNILLGTRDNSLFFPLSDNPIGPVT